MPSRSRRRKRGALFQGNASRIGCPVQAVDGADAALELAAADPSALDLIFADARLPGGGAALIARLRELDPDLPCVLLHAGASPA